MNRGTCTSGDVRMSAAMPLVRMFRVKRASSLLTSADVERPDFVLWIYWLLHRYWQYTLHLPETYYAQAA
jgi:hypothetical protein